MTTTNELLAAERLVPMRVFAPETQIDHDGVRRNRVGQYDKAELARRTTKVRGNVVAQWVEHKNEVFGPGVRVPTAVFTNTIEDGRAYADEFQRAGYDFRQTTYRTSDRLVRGDVLAAFERREIDGVISCQALAKGWDSSAVLCIIDLQSNGSSVMPVIQKYGRGMRIHADIDADGVVRHQRFSAELERKEQFLLLDHVGNVEGWADQIVDLYENGVGDLRAAKKQYGGQRDDSKRDRGDVTCPACGFLLPAAVRACPSCGRERRRRPATREATDSTRLVERKLEQFISRQEREAEQWRGQIRAKYEDRPNLVWYAVCAFAEKRAETTEAKWARDEKGRRWFAAKQFETLMGVRPARGARYMPDRLSCPNDIDQAIRAQLRSFAIKRKQREDATE